VSGEGIDIPITFGGASMATGAIDDLGRALGEGGDDAKKFAAEQERAMRATIEMTGRAAAAAAQISNFGRIIGNETIEAVGGLAARMAQSAQQFAALGSALGPQGALVGGIVGAAIPAIGELVAAEESAADAAREHEEAIDAVVAAWARQREAAALVGAAEAGDDNQARTQSLAGLDDSGVVRAIERELAAQALLRQSLQEMRYEYATWTESEEEHTRAMMEAERQGGARMVGLNAERAAIVQQIDATQRTVEALREEQEARRHVISATEQQAAMMGALAAARAEELAAIRELAEEERKREEQQRRAEAARRAAQARAAEEERAWQTLLTEEIQQYDRMAAAADRAAQADEEMNRARVEQARVAAESLERLQEETRLADVRRMEEARAYQQEVADQQEREIGRRTQRLNEHMGRAVEIGTEVTSILGEAIGEVILGTKSSEEAFLGMLKSFLELISQQAALSAGKEFAEAIASFARYDYSGGAMHVAAGAAFTAVAVATGIGAAAIAPPQAAAPAEPTRSEDRGRGGGDVIIQWNAPVYTSGQRAEMGRELGGLLRDAEMAA
jgi:hypothetical protein